MKDDEPLFNVIHEKIIHQSNPSCNIRHFSDPKHAMETLVPFKEPDIENIPDNMFLDMNMPGINGWDFMSVTTHSRCSYKGDAAMVLLSGSFHSSALENPKKHPGIVRVIPKPLTVEIINDVSEMLTSSSS